MIGDALLPEDVRVALERASAALLRRDYDTAEREAATALAKAPETARAHAIVGIARKAKGQFEHARASLREATRKAPGDAAVHLALAEVELELGDPARALLEAQKARELGAPLGESTLCLASARFDFDLSIVRYKKIEGLFDNGRTMSYCVSRVMRMSSIASFEPRSFSDLS